MRINDNIGEINIYDKNSQILYRHKLWKSEMDVDN